MPTRARRSYDHRIKQRVVRSGIPDLFPEFDIPRSTTRSWLRRGPSNVVALDAHDETEAGLQQRIVTLQRRIEMLTAVLRLVLAVVRVAGVRLELCRTPKAANKRLVLSAVDRARRAMPLSAALRVLGLSAARYHAWVRADETCALDDRPSCPRTAPQRLTSDEIQTIGEMVQSKAYRHMPIRALALHAQRIGKVFAHPATWARLIRDRRWRRPRLRVYPPKPKIGFRADAPNVAWHIDVSVIKLLDGTKAYLHGVIDNYSRRILAWTIAPRLDPTNTSLVLAQAARGVESASKTDVYMDSGIENLNAHVDQLFGDGLLQRVLAHVDVAFSNSMIEAWWRSLKHQWLFLHPLTDLATVKKLVAFYVAEHNGRMPHSAFRGQTPDEMYFGRGLDVLDELAAQRREARARRAQSNRSSACHRCPRGSPRTDCASTA